MVRFASKRSKRSHESFGATSREHSHGLKIYFGADSRDFTFCCDSPRLTRDSSRPRRSRDADSTEANTQDAARIFYSWLRSFIFGRRDLIFLGWISKGRYIFWRSILEIWIYFIGNYLFKIFYLWKIILLYKGLDFLQFTHLRIIDIRLQLEHPAYDAAHPLSAQQPHPTPIWERVEEPF